MIDALIKALQTQNIAEEKIQVIVDKLMGVNDTASGNGHWRALCEGCLEVGIDPQALFALAASLSEDLSDIPEQE